MIDFFANLRRILKMIETSRLHLIVLIIYYCVTLCWCRGVVVFDEANAQPTTISPTIVFPTELDVTTTTTVNNITDVDGNFENETVDEVVQPSFFSERPLRDSNGILIPNTDHYGRPACLKNTEDTFREHVPNYPEADLKKDINFSPAEFREVFGVKEIDGRKMYQDEDINEERVCRRIPKVIYLQMAKNQAKQWVYIVNDVEYVQAVVSEVCEKEGKACAYMDHNLPPGVYSSCRQKYAYRRLLAIHPTEKRTYTDTFQFPSCCACYVKGPSFARTLSRSKERK